MRIRTFIKSLLPFLPLMVFYVIIILVFSADELTGDESRYYGYATNLINGFYADVDNPELRNGPGYPLVICLFVLFNAPYIIIKLFNVVLLMGAVLYFYKTLKIYISVKQAMVFAYFMGLFTSLLKYMVFIYSESFALFLACGFLYHFIQLNRPVSNKYFHIGFSALFLGLLTLTKVIFGFVIICILILCFLLFILKKSKKILNITVVLAGAFFLCTPYLFYTYTLTGKTLYWGTQGGEILYWRSSPFPNEYGNWISSDVVLGKIQQGYVEPEIMYNNHGAFIESLESYSYIQKDSLFKQKAIENMKQYPLKYIKNTTVSALRLFFNYPFSYTRQKTSTYFYLIPNIILLSLILFSSYLAIRKIRAIPLEVRIIALLSMLYIGGIILLNGRSRHLIAILPMLLFFIAFVCNKLIDIKIKLHTDNDKLNSI